MTAKWDEPTVVDGLERRCFVVQADARSVPGVFWCKPGHTGRAPLVLIGHGGSQHKESPEVLDLAKLHIEEHGFVAAAIDGPIHGARRSDAASPTSIRDEFLAMWAVDNRIDQMITDWRAAMDTLAGLPQVDPAAMGWCGISMGTAYGLPLCAADARIKAAVLGMWSSNYPNSDRLARDAASIEQPVLFQQKWNDQLFDREGQLAIFDAFSSIDKLLYVYPGGHTHPTGDQRHDIGRFLRNRLLK
jgi:dienelactone hydrolase